MMIPVPMISGYGWLADAYQYVDSGCLMSALENEIDSPEPLQWILESVVSPKQHVGGQYPDCFEQDEAD